MSKLAKRLTALLLSGMLVIGSAPVGSFAAELGQTSEVAVEEAAAEEVVATGDTAAPAEEDRALAGDTAAPAEEVAEEQGITGSTDVPAEEAAQYYTVTFDANGGYFENEWDDAVGDYVENTEVLSKNIPVGGIVETVPVKESATFLGWSLEPDGELVSPVEEEYVPVDNCTLFAVWQVEESVAEGETTEDVPTVDEVPAEDVIEGDDPVEVPVEEDSAVEETDVRETLDEGDGQEAEFLEDGEQIETEQDAEIDPAQDADIAEIDFAQDAEIADAQEAEETSRMTAEDQEPEAENAEAEESAAATEAKDTRTEKQDDTFIEESSPAESSKTTPEMSDIENAEEESVSEEAANGGTCGDSITWTLDEEGTLTISGKGKMTDYDCVGKNAGNNNYYYYYTNPWDYYDVKKVIIKNGVTSIGEWAFAGCTCLTSVTIPDSVTSIGWGAFYGCSSLKSITIPNSVTSIGEYAFYECTSLTSVTIPNSVTSIGEGAFYECTSLTSVTIPNSVTSIGWDAFEGCTRLKSVTIPSSVTIIEDGTFSGCSSLTSVTIPNSVTSIGNCAFEGCTRLTSVTIPNSVTSIGYRAFEGCTRLKSVTIPSSVTSIKSSTFSGCSSLTSVTIPSSVTSIGGLAFEGCTSLKKIYFKGDAPNIYLSSSYSEDSAFYGVTADAYYPLNNKTWTEDKLQNYGGHLTWITQLSLKNATVTGIKDRTFTKTVRSEGATQSITVKLNNKKLKSGTDYKVSYENNKEAGTATVVITGKGKYVGSVKKTFKINLAKPSLASLASKNHGRVSCKINTVYGATGYQIHYVDTKTNEKNTFTGKLKENSKNMTVPGLVGGHTYKFKVRAYRSVNGSPKSAWSKEKSIKVYRGKSIADGTVYIEGAVDGKGKKFTYRGSQIKPKVQLKLKSKILTTTLKQDSDYKVSYTNNTNAGTATITFKGIGKYYGTLKKTFKIYKYTLKSSDVTIGSTTYTAKKANPTVTVKVNSKKQKENVDYKASTSSVNAGTGKMTVKGIGKNLTGTVTKNFKIRPLDINKCTVELPDGDSYAYTGEHIRPIVVVTYNGTNVPYEPDKTFDIDDSQSQNVEAGDGYITIVGRGNLTGSVKKNIEIRAGFLWPTEAKNNTVSTLFYYSGGYKENPHGNHGVGNPIDIPGTIGDDIYAVADGTVEDASYGAYGNHIYIRLEDGSKLIYGHLNAFHVKKDDKVKAGQVIGELGNTGNSTGPHLHFAWEGGNAWSKYYKNYPGFHLKYQTSVYEANNYHYNEDSRSAEVIDWFKEHYFKDGEFQGVWVQ